LDYGKKEEGPINNYLRTGQDMSGTKGATCNSPGKRGGVCEPPEKVGDKAQRGTKGKSAPNGGSFNTLQKKITKKKVLLGSKKSGVIDQPSPSHILTEKRGGKKLGEG